MLTERIQFKRGKICEWNPKVGFMYDGKPIYIVGTNYVARYICTNFWEDWRPLEIREDLEKISKYGLNAVRIPVHWEYAEPALGKFRPEAIERFGKFLDMAEELGLFVMPWFLVGVATMDYDVSWRKGRSFFEEPMRTYAANHITKFVKEYKDRPNILCWDICDEPEWYSRHPGADSLPYNTQKVNAWIKTIYEAIKSEDSLHAVTLGFGHIASGNYGMNIRDAAKTLDVMAITAYPPHGGEDCLHGFRSTYFLGWSCCFNDCIGKGIFTCEAPGMSTIAVGEESIAKYFRISLYSNYANDSRGALPWVWNDFEHKLWITPPFIKHPIEVGFGMVRTDGAPKLSLDELCAFRKFINKYPPSEWKKLERKAAIVVPSDYTDNTDKRFTQSFHNYIFLRQAHFSVNYIWEQDIKELSLDTEILVLPQTSGNPYHPDVWLKAIDFVKNGGIIICTGGISPWFSKLFGVEVEDSMKRRENFKVRAEGIARDFDGLEIPAGRNQIIVKPVKAKVMAKDSKGVPLILVNKLGKGKACFISYAFDWLMEEFTPEQVGIFPMHSLYRNLTKESSKKLPVECLDPRIELDIRQHKDGRILATLINHSRFDVQTSLIKSENQEEVEKVKIKGSGVEIRESR